MNNKIVIVLFLVSLNLFSSVWANEERESTISFTQEEKEWIQNHPIIRVANETDWPPFDFVESGIAKGLGIDHISFLAKQVGLNIEFVNGYPWAELIALFEKREIDVMPALYRNAERERFTLFTSPYYRGKLGVFTHSDSQSWHVNLSKQNVGMQTSHGSIPLIKKLMPGITIIEVDSTIELTRKLATKQLDAIIGNPFVFYFLAKESQVENIQLSNFITMSNDEQLKTSLHIGVRKDLPILHSILQKAMQGMKDEEMDKIEKEWADITIVKKTNWILIAQVSLVVCFIVLFLLWHNRNLKSIVAAKTLELKRINEGLELTVIQRTKELTTTNNELTKSFEELKTLRGIIPICASCKNIRDDSGYWDLIESYIAKHSLAEFSHSICPDCAKKLYPEFVDKNGTL